MSGIWENRHGFKGVTNEKIEGSKVASIPKYSSWTVVIDIHLNFNWQVVFYLAYFRFHQKERRHGAPSLQANCTQNGGILFKTDFYLINTKNYFVGSTNDTFEPQVADTAGREE